jgi:cholesterol oxidase
MHCKDRGLLPHLPATLGNKLRTNSEAICGAMSGSGDVNYSRGVAITSGAHFDRHTHIEVVRYGEGHDALSVLATLLTDGGGRVPRGLRWLATVARHPVQFLRTCWKWGWAKRGIILLVMQTLDNSLNARWRRRWWWPFAKTLRTERPAGQAANPTYIPIGNEVARRVAQKIGGIPMSAVNEVLLDIPTTAHILGGCSIGPEGRGVVDAHHRVYGYQGLYVCDGSVVPANLGVNPSLTITALTEHAMAAVPPKHGEQVQPIDAAPATVWQAEVAA